MNDSLLGRLVDRGDGRANLVRVRLGCSEGPSLRRPDAAKDGTVAQGAADGLSSAFAGGFRVGHS